MSERRVALENACGEFEADLVLFYYGEGTDAERHRVQEHLAGCRRCSRFLEDLRGLLPHMAQSANLPRSFWDDYYREMVHKLDRERERKSWWRNWSSALTFKGWAVPAFGTVAVAAVAVTLIFGKLDWSSTVDQAQQETIPVELLTDSGRLEFFKSMDLIESLTVLEKMDASRPQPAEVQSL